MEKKKVIKDAPKSLLQVLHSIFPSAVNGNPCVNGPANTAGASAIKHEIFGPRSGRMPSERETNAVPLPCEWPMKPIWSIQGGRIRFARKGLLNERERDAPCPSR